MDFRLLEEFVLVSQQKSIRKAAALLGVSPAALSQRMSVLEQTLGVALLLRTKQSTSLTEAGEKFTRDAERFLRQYHQSLDKIVARDEHLYSSLRVVISGELMPYALASVLDSLNFRYPDLHLELLDDRSYGLKESLSSGSIDLYFAFYYGDDLGEEIVSEVMFISKMYAVVRNDHRLAGRVSVSLQDLAGETFILYPHSADGRVRQYQVDMLKRSGIRYSVYETETPHSLYTFLLPIGKGVLLSPWIMTGKLTPNSVVIPLEDDAGITEYRMLYRRDTHNPALLKIVQEICQIVREEDHP